MATLNDSEAKQFEEWRASVARLALQSGMSVKITDDHWDWFRAKFDGGYSVADVIRLAQIEGLT